MRNVRKLSGGVRPCGFLLMRADEQTDTETDILTTTLIWICVSVCLSVRLGVGYTVSPARPGGLHARLCHAFLHSGTTSKESGSHRHDRLVTFFPHHWSLVITDDIVHCDWSDR